MTPLTILGQGAVSPGGIGVNALLDSKAWPLTTLNHLGKSDRASQVSTVDTAALESWRGEARFRRASKISLFMAEAARQALAEAPEISPEKIGLVVGLFTGGIIYSRRFYQEILEQGARCASPALFPETVYNSPASHLVSAFKLGGPVYSIVGDETVWLNAISTAQLWLELDQAEAVLVLGAEELDPVAVEAYHRAGWMKRGFYPAEGASALLLSKKAAAGKIEIQEWKESFIHRTRPEAQIAHEKLHRSLGSIPRQGTPWHPWQRDLFPIDSAPQTSHHAFAASAAWQTIREAAKIRKAPTALPLLGCNHQSSALILAPCQW